MVEFCTAGCCDYGSEWKYPSWIFSADPYFPQRCCGQCSLDEPKGGLPFRSTLQDAADDRPQMSMEKWDTSRAPAIPHEEERTTILPEAGSGILLSIGLIAVIGVGRLRVAG